MPLYLIISCIAVSLLLSFLIFPKIIKLSHKFEYLDYPGKRKRHKQPIPFTGGMTLFVIFWVTYSICWVVNPSLFNPIAFRTLFIFLGSLIITMVGFSDDLKPLSAWIKLLAQIAAGLILYFGGLEVELLGTPFGEWGIGNFSIVITVIWVVGLTNAINLIDGLDGLAGGVSLIGAVTMLVIGQLYQVGAELVFVLILIGFLPIFLYYNKYPAKIFLGDSGSMQLGFYFAVYSLSVSQKSYTAVALYVPLLVLGVPLMEMLSSFIRRLLSGKGIMTADRRHLFHYLSLMGLSPRMVLTVFYLLSLIYGLFAVSMFFWDRSLVLGFFVIFMVVIFAVFFIFIFKFIPRRNLNRRD